MRLIFLVSLSLCFPACNTIKDTGREIVGDVIDCTAPNVQEVAAHAVPFAVSVLRYATQPDGAIDWAPLRELVTHSPDGQRYEAGTPLPTGVAIAGCAVATAIARALAPPPADPNAPQIAALAPDPAALRVGFEQLRADLGGRRFVTDSGTL